MIESNRLVPNIVYLRDTSLLQKLNKSIEQLSQKDVFQHENFVDVKELVKEREIRERYELNDSPLMKARQRIMTQ